MKHILFAMAGVLLLMQLDTPLATRFIFFVTYLAILIANRYNVNIVTLITTLILVKISEVAIHQLYTLTTDSSTPYFYLNNRIYLTHLAFDVLLFVFVIFRAPLCRVIFNQLDLNSRKLHLINADMGLVVVYAIYILVDLSAAAENVIRNLEHIGFSEETAKRFWGWDWLYYHYADIKRILMGLEFLVIWSFILGTMQNKFNPIK